MQQKTADFLIKLENMKWFSNVGSKKNSADNTDVVFVSSWDEALECTFSDIAEDALTEANGELTTFLHDNHRAEYARWNAIVDELKPLTEKLIKRKVSEAEADRMIPPKFPTDSFRWDILQICLNLEYSEQIETEYYKRLAYWYLAGHFPCGWEGEVPEDFKGAFQVGKLVVY
jgi:hypothetical protein